MKNWTLTLTSANGEWTWELYGVDDLGRTTHVTAKGPLKLLRLYLKARRRSP